MKKVLLGLALLLQFLEAHAQVNNDEMNAANSPLTPMAAVNLHDYILKNRLTDDDRRTASVGAHDNSLFAASYRTIKLLSA